MVKTEVDQFTEQISKFSQKLTFSIFRCEKRRLRTKKFLPQTTRAVIYRCPVRCLHRHIKHQRRTDQSEKNSKSINRTAAASLQVKILEFLKLRGLRRGVLHFHLFFTFRCCISGYRQNIKSRPIFHSLDNLFFFNRFTFC